MITTNAERVETLAEAAHLLDGVAVNIAKGFLAADMVEEVCRVRIMVEQVRQSILTQGYTVALEMLG